MWCRCLIIALLKEYVLHSPFSHYTHDIFLYRISSCFLVYSILPISFPSSMIRASKCPFTMIYYCTCCIQACKTYSYVNMWPNSLWFHSLTFSLSFFNLSWKICIWFVLWTFISSHQILTFDMNYESWSQKLLNQKVKSSNLTPHKLANDPFWNILCITYHYYFFVH